MTNAETEKYYKMTMELVEKSFPILKGRKIKVKIINKFFRNLCPFSATADWGFNSLIIRVNPKYNIYNDFEFRGILAHELSHLEDWVERGKLYKFFNDLICQYSRKKNTKYEKRMDTNAIHKGYGKELYAQRLKRETKKDKNYMKNKNSYLSPNSRPTIFIKSNSVTDLILNKNIRYLNAAPKGCQKGLNFRLGRILFILPFVILFYGKRNKKIL